MNELSRSGERTDTQRLIRRELWSPVQNTSLWLAWWLHGVISTDDLISSFHAVQGRYHRLLSGSATPVAVTDELADEATGLIDLLRAARQVTQDAPVGVAERPLVSLVLAGMGDPPPLPVGEAASAVAAAGAGIALADPDPEVHHVAVPELVDGSVVYWHWYTAEGRSPTLQVGSPGEAETLLRETADQAVRGIQASGAQVQWGRAEVGPRLLVGELSDAFGVPGLPPRVPERAEKLMARADYVSAIIEVARHSPQAASLDPFILPLGRPVRLARMLAVDYAQRELLR